MRFEGSSAALTLLLLTSFATASQDDKRSKSERSKEKIQFDLSFDHEPSELYKDVIGKLRWKRLIGPFGIGEFHIFPARESGPYLGPPRRIWGHGIGTSLWRDPVTGWPLL